ncbi:MAG: hypothetical protein KBD53_04385 [Candidatus Omnitrophica bacterium]|nr:hypothetical protein [Candidatus Omnitrophota bacterium]
MEQFDATSIVFQHLIDLPNCDCIFCSAVENATGRTRLLLVFKERKRIYIRNGLKDTWDELKESNQYKFIMDGFNRAIHEQKIPCFSA